MLDLLKYIGMKITIKKKKGSIKLKNKINNQNNLAPYILLFVQPIFMASNLIVARGGVEFVPPISLAFWRWTTVFVLLIPFFYKPILKKIKSFKDEF